MAISWLTAWQDLIEDDMAHEHGLVPLHAKYPARNSERVTKTRSPGGTASDAFGYVVDIGCVDPDHSYVRDFLAWTIEMGEAMLRDARRWETQWATLAHAQRSLLNGVLALAYGLRDNLPPDAALLKASREEAIAAYAEAKGGNWDEHAQSDHLRSIQFCLIEGDMSAAAHMLRGKRRYGMTQQWHDWLAEFIGIIEAAGGGKVTDTAAIDAFDALFDQVRNPKYKPILVRGQVMMISRPLLRIQLAILRHKYIDGGPIIGCWPQILKSIAA